MSAGWRLWLASGLAFAALGLTWDWLPARVDPGLLLSSTLVDMFGDLVLTTNYFPGGYVEGGPRPGRSTDARAVLMPAAAALAAAARWPRPTTERVAGIAAGALALVALRGLAGGVTPGVAAAVTSAALAGSALPATRRWWSSAWSWWSWWSSSPRRAPRAGPRAGARG